eukprot:15354949-Ditylum_brightwellii.AAC.1
MKQDRSWEPNVEKQNGQMSQFVGKALCVISVQMIIHIGQEKHGLLVERNHTVIVHDISLEFVCATCGRVSKCSKQSVVQGINDGKDNIKAIQSTEKERVGEVKILGSDDG